ncbi:MAG: hypothetical protein WBV82_01885 [Myxococcaceae bacterium]
MTGLLHAHSGIRYLVLLAAVVAIAYFAYGLATKKPVTRAVRILGAIYVGLLDLQVLLGLGVIAMGLWYPALAGHVTMMVLAAAVAHVMTAKNRRLPQPGYTLPLIGVGVSLLLIIGGILAIGRNPLTMAVTGAA